MKERSGSRAAVDERYAQWKSLIPVLYDWFANHNLVWPSLSCRKMPCSLHHVTLQLMMLISGCLLTGGGHSLRKLPTRIVSACTYLNRQVHLQTDGSVPNTLVIANCEVVKPRVAAAEHISQFNEEARSPFVKKYKTIVHPGEVNRIRELPQNSKIIATHTDSPDVLIWDVEAQPNRHAVLGASESRPDLILTGHKENAEFALAMCPAEPYVLSGGKDKSVVLWSIQDHISALGDSSSSPGASGSKQSIKTANEKESPKVDPRGIFHGHDSTVEDVQFCPSSAQEFCSVGDDACLILWDARTGTAPAVKVEKAHSGDVHCVDWNPLDVNYILTGSADNSVRMWDRRNLGSGGAGSPIHKFEGHKAAVLCVQACQDNIFAVIFSLCGCGCFLCCFFIPLFFAIILSFGFQWSPDRASVFGSSAEDGFLNVWDHEKVGKKKNSNVPAGLFFQHAGHRDKIVDFHWNSSDPWTIVSVSDDGESTGGGGTLQIWRMSDLIYRPEDEVLAELENFKAHLASCAPKN
ncbi:WD-40 repeat-containing protein MSI4 [Zea mays]|uniref:WD-40 repeat-containing protein MSI4 n=3 Tax=Zea mays TaxID=4577 RepID=A0A1D6G362_MAIZE|nr:WD-40 repeat-containing protein MSI4 [Zea mays]